MPMKRKNIDRMAVRLAVERALSGFDSIPDRDAFMCGFVVRNKELRHIAKIHFATATKQYLYTITVSMLKGQVSQTQHDAIAKSITDMNLERNVMVRSERFGTLC